MGGPGSGVNSGNEKLFKTPAILQQLVTEYFDKTDTELMPVYHKQLTKEGALVKLPTRRPYTVEGLCLHLGTSRVTLLEYQKLPEYADIITMAKQRITKDQIERALIGENNAQFTKFNLINNSDYVDEKRVDHTSGGEKIT